MKSIVACLMSITIWLRIGRNLADNRSSFGKIVLETGQCGSKCVKGEVTIPTLFEVQSWRVIMKFNKTLTDFKVYDARIRKRKSNGAVFEVGNLITDRFLSAKDVIHFQFRGLFDGVRPNATVTLVNAANGLASERDRPPAINQETLQRITNSIVDYRRAMRLSLKMFNGQRSGYLSKDNAFGWKNSSGIEDGSRQQVDLVGGYYSGGDYVKYNFPMAFATTQLVWGALEFYDGYESAGAMADLFKTVKWATDYFIKCNPKKDEYYYQVGDPAIDHSMWESSENMNWSRPAYKLSPDKPVSGVTGETAAALAAASILFKSSDPTYSAKLVKAAKSIWKLGKRYKGAYDPIQNAPEYRSTGYRDELVWGALWIYKATSNKLYLNSARTGYSKLIKNMDEGFSLNSKILGIQLLLYDITKKSKFMLSVKRFCNKPTGKDGYILPNGLLYHDSWFGPVMYAANAAFVCSYASRRSENKATRYARFVKSQIHIILGTDVQNGYMVGFGQTYPTNLHHRESSCPVHPKPCGWDFYEDETLPNANELSGAIVGGPNGTGDYVDTRTNSKFNQPNILYNAAVQSSLAFLIMLENGHFDSEDNTGDSTQADFIAAANLDRPFAEDSADQALSVCSPNPCRNNGVCKRRGRQKFSCKCHKHYAGKICDLALKPEIEWIENWRGGARLYIHLPKSMMKRKETKLNILLPQDCNVWYTEIWNGCFLTSNVNLKEGRITIQQRVMDRSYAYFEVALQVQEISAVEPCLKTENFKFKVSSSERIEGFCVTYLETETEETTLRSPDLQDTISSVPNLAEILNTPLHDFTGHLPIISHEKNVVGQLCYIFATFIELTHSCHSSAVGQDLIKDLGLSRGDMSMISWNSRWGAGGQGHINLDKAVIGAGRSWNLRLLFPPGCYLSTAQFWHACVVDSLTQPENGLFTLRQVGWQVYQTFIGLFMTFKEVAADVDCYNPSNYYVRFEESTAGSGMFPDSCTEEFQNIGMPEASLPSDVLIVGEERSSPAPVSSVIEITRDPEGTPATRATTTRTVTRPPRTTAGTTRKPRATTTRRTTTTSKQTTTTRTTTTPPPTTTATTTRPPATTRPPTTTTTTTITTTTTLESTTETTQPSPTTTNKPTTAAATTTTTTSSTTAVPPTTSTVTTTEPSTIAETTSAEPQTTTTEVTTPSTTTTATISETPSTEPPTTATATTASTTTTTGVTTPPTTVVTTLSSTANPVDLGNLWRLVIPTPEQNDGRITRLRIKTLSKTSVQLTWGRPNARQRRISINYGITEPEEGVQELPSASWPTMSREVPARSTGVEISGLQPGGTYEFTARAWDGNTYGPASSVSVALSPLEIGDIRVSNPNGTALRFHWLKPPGFLSTYLVAYFPPTETGFPKSPFTLPGTDTRATISGLDRRTEYLVSFVVQNGDTQSGATNVSATTGSNFCGIRGCQRFARCVQTNSTGQCVCNFGFTEETVIRQDTERKVCRDVDECAETNDCDENAICSNSRGSYRCRCEEGYEGDGKRCYDIDECSIPGIDICSGALCINTGGSYTCQCDEGYTYRDGDCEDVDECESEVDEVCPENAECSNTDGSYSCNCPEGSIYAEDDCQDIDECVERLDNCHSSQVCVNVRNGFSCQCPSGTRTVDGNSCRDIDECAENRDNCNQNAICTNTDRSFSCSCKTGFVGNGVLCKDINECLQENDCDEAAGECINTVGSYSCTCRPEFSGDGKDCFPL